ncbi:tyrosine-type recombinase/integrase [Streptomyces sp. NPDC096033]|uniref:tyrosine-type recombinase/integrase n=1 Tax=Streptomyces sp. NPDC096033 TaxID=3366071 RepID=UPI00382067AD
MYTDPSGRVRKPPFEHYDEAVKFLAATTTDIARGTWVDPEAGKILAVKAAEEWLEWIKKKHGVENTIETYASHAKTHVIPFLGRRPAGSLRRADSNAFVDELIGKGLAESYIHQVFKTWRIFVHWMVDEKEIPLPANIVSRIKLPEVPQRKVVDLSPQQVARIAECIEPRFEVLVWEAACGGVREGEAFGMTKDRVDFLRRRWHIKEQRQRGQAVKTKTKASMTWVSVDQFLLDKIAAHLAAGFDRPAQVQHATELRRIRRQAQGLWTPPTDEGLIVTNHAGRPLTRQTFHPYWRDAVEEAGVDPDARFHDLKGFYTRTLATSGDHDPKTVQRLSRHARFEETWDTYAETGAGAEDVKVTAFSSAFTATGDTAEAATG